MVLSAVALRRMMVFSGVTSQCEQRGMESLWGSRSTGRNFEIVSTIVPAGTTLSAEADLVGQSIHHVETLPQSNCVPSVHMQWRIIASFRATATFAFLGPMRLASLSPHALSGDVRRTTLSSTFAASNK